MNAKAGRQSLCPGATKAIQPDIRAQHVNDVIITCCCDVDNWDAMWHIAPQKDSHLAIMVAN